MASESPNSNETNQPEQEPQTQAKTIMIAESELEQLKKECIEYKDKYLRQLAEMDNMRKRLQKERQEITQSAAENVIIDFLTPIDHMENALKFTQQMSEDVKNWSVGFQMILTQFKDALANNGVNAFTSQGSAFDPHLHEAIEMVQTNDFPPGTIVEESLRGYKMGDRTLRPARVKVAKAPQNSK